MSELVRQSTKKGFAKMLDLIAKIDELFGYLETLPHDKFAVAKDEIILLLIEFSKLLKFEHKLSEIDKIYTLMPSLFEHFALLIEKSVIRSLVEQVSILAKRDPRIS